MKILAAMFNGKALVCVALLAVLLHSCNWGATLMFRGAEAMEDLAETIQLKRDTTPVDLLDYFSRESLSKLDSMTMPGRLTAYRSGSDIYLFARSAFLPPYAEVRFWVEGAAYSIMVESSHALPRSFVFDPQGERYRSVSLRGDMTGWSVQPLHLMDGQWQSTFRVGSGRYEYVLVVNGREMTDPSNPIQAEENGQGARSVWEVGTVEEALLPQISYDYFSRQTLYFQLNNPAEEVFVLWENFRLPPQYVFRQGNVLRVRLPADARRKSLSHIRVWAYNKEGVAPVFEVVLHKGRPN